MTITTSLPSGWSIEHDADGNITVSSPSGFTGSLSCAIDTGTVMADESDIRIPGAVMRILERHARALECRPVAICLMKKGNYFLRSPLAATVYIRGDFDRALHRISCSSFDDMNREFFLHPDAIVYMDFTF